MKSTTLFDQSLLLFFRFFTERMSTDSSFKDPILPPEGDAHPVSNLQIFNIKSVEIRFSIN